METASDTGYQNTEHVRTVWMTPYKRLKNNTDGWEQMQQWEWVSDDEMVLRSEIMSF